MLRWAAGALVTEVEVYALNLPACSLRAAHLRFPHGHRYDLPQQTKVKVDARSYACDKHTAIGALSRCGTRQ